MKLGRKQKYIIAKCISLLPVSRLRCLLYNQLLCYQIRDSRIGRGTVIAVDDFQAAQVCIGGSNRFVGPISVKIGRNVSIGHRNEFSCEAWVLKSEFKKSGYRRSLLVGDEVLITSDHFFDIAGEVSVGARSWFAGRATQVWSHGAGVEDRNVKVGSDCYVGSASRIAPGAEVADHTVMAMGAVVVKKHCIENVLLGGVPAKEVKLNYDSVLVYTV